MGPLCMIFGYMGPLCMIFLSCIQHMHATQMILLDRRLYQDPSCFWLFPCPFCLNILTSFPLSSLKPLLSTIISRNFYRQWLLCVQWFWWVSENRISKSFTNFNFQIQNSTIWLNITHHLHEPKPIYQNFDNI